MIDELLTAIEKATRAYFEGDSEDNLRDAMGDLMGVIARTKDGIIPDSLASRIWYVANSVSDLLDDIAG